ncbi:WSC domain-containing protein [Colletotrichum tofieldiae]|nr:WSC domain-containing protein [Colletotrichum tofieldiae]GKT81027.1 WSC domain-containing protein [Colletotrichum tofieldiae]GKT88464.1 WSC domain-containing protein [Colletotrichum tofieldiae]
MKFSAAATLAALFGAASAGSKSDDRTFAVLRFNNKELVKTRVDPIINPGKPATHVHGVMGGSNFGMSATGETLSQSKCTNAMINGDNSAYWFPSLYFQDPKTKEFEPVEVFYVNVYYFFDGTDDEIKAFPRGLQIFSGNASARTPPSNGGKQNLDPEDGPIQPVQWTCPRSSYNPPSYPANSDGSTAGIVDPNNQGSGVGFPDQNCDGFGSPLRADVHMPSCYNPKAALEDYQSMTWPSRKGASNGGRKNCPEGWIHVPHMFFEVYWDTPKFADRWTPGQGAQPFVLSNGDASGYSLHADFIAAWDEDVLQQIIDNCNAGSSGMDKCPGLLKGLNTNKDCKIDSPLDEVTDGILAKLPGDNPLGGFSFGPIVGGSDSGAAVKPSSGASSVGSAKPSASKAVSDSVSQEEAPKTSATASSQLPIQVAPEKESTKPDGPTKAAEETSAAAAAPTASLGGSKPSKATSCLRKTKTVWKTVTVTSPAEESGAAATPSGSADDYSKARRHVHEHMQRHRSHRD